MPNYPTSAYTPRIKQNKVGVIYDPLIPTTLFAEDISLLDAEVVAIETDLISKIDQAVKTDSSPQFAQLKAVASHVGNDEFYVDTYVETFTIDIDGGGTTFIDLSFPTLEPMSSYSTPTLCCHGNLFMLSLNNENNSIQVAQINTTTHKIIVARMGVDVPGERAKIDNNLALFDDVDYYAMDALSYSVAGTPPVADGTYTIGARLTPSGVDGAITVQGGIITAITPAT